MKKSADVDRYISGAPAWARATLRTIRKTIRTVAPKAEEKISYGMPYYRYHGRLAYFAAFKEHCSFFWISAADKKKFSKILKNHLIAGSTLRIPRDSRPPLAFITRILRAHAKINEMKIASLGFKICSRGHKYRGRGCPICWSGFRKGRVTKG